MTKITLTVNEKARKEANLRLLKRSVNRNIVDIVGDYTATHVVLYFFHSETQCWEKSNIEGSLSVAVTSTAGPVVATDANIDTDGASHEQKQKYLLIILNRNTPENYSMELTSDFQLQQNNPYLIFKNYETNITSNCNDSNCTTTEPTTTPTSTATIRGIWFPNDNERTKMNDLLVNVLQSLKNNSSSNTPTTVAEPGTAPSATTTTTTVSMATVAPIDRNAATAALFASLNIGSDNGSGDGNNTSTAATEQQQQQQQSQTGATATTNDIASASSSQQIQTQTPTTLDKKSLQLALLSLIQEERFLDLLHAQYLKVHHSRTNK